MLVNSDPIEYTSHSADQTRRMGIKLGESLQAGDVICLQGDLGAGKTTFVQGIAQGWGSTDAVSSPTFILVNIYRRAEQGKGRVTPSLLFHMDAYRLDSTPEAEELDLDSMLAQGALIIEWPERMETIIPAERLWILFEHLGDQERGMTFNARGHRAQTLLEIVRGGA